MEFDVETFRSTVWKLCGMPALDPELHPNIAEGVVIKPITGFKLRTGSRAILKIKSKVFYEKVKTKHKTAKKIVDYTEDHPDVDQKLLSQSVSSKCYLAAKKFLDADKAS